MASRGSGSNNKISEWEPNAFTSPANANVADAEAMTSPAAQAARAKSAEVMAALKKGDQGEADRVMGKKEHYDSLLPGMGRLKTMFLGKKKEDPTK